MQILLIALGGALGSVMRYGVSRLTQPLGGGDFPAGTLTVNLTGAFGVGLLVTYLLERSTISAELRVAATVGLLGVYTTFSTFALETVELIDAGEWFYAAANILGSVVVALFAVWLGQTLARS